MELRRLAAFLQKDKTAFATLLTKKTQADLEKERKVLDAELQRCTARNEQVAKLCERLYEDNVNGKVTDEWFMQMSHKYEVERMELKNRIADIRVRLSDMGNNEK